MNLRLKILVTFFIFVLIYAIYYCAIPAVFNKYNYVPMIENIAKKDFGINIKLKKTSIKMGLVPSIWIKTDEFLIMNDNNSRALFIEKPILKIDLIPLIFGNIDLKYFYAKNIMADLTCDKNLNIRLGQYLLIKSSNSKLKINKAKIIVDNYDIYLYDEPLNKKTYMKGDFFELKKFISGKEIVMSGASKLIQDNKNSNISFDLNFKLPFRKNFEKNPPEFNATITNLELSGISNYLNYLTDGEIKKINGLVNFDVHSGKFKKNEKEFIANIVIEKFSIAAKNLTKPFKYPAKIELSGNFLAQNDALTINKLNFKAPKVNIDLNGVITKITSKNPIPDLTLSIKNTRAEGILDLLPYSSTIYSSTELDISTIKAAGFYGDVYSNIKITNNIQTPLLTGKTLISNAYVIKPILNAKKATILMNFYGKHLMLDVDVPTAPKEKVKVTGKIDLYGKKYSDLDIKSTKYIDLALAEMVLIPLHKGLNFEIGPVPIMDINGFGNINLKVTGNKQNPHAYGVFRTNNASVSFNDIHNLKLTNADVELTFNDLKTNFITKKGFINAKPAKVYGTCDLMGHLNYNVVTKKQDLGDLLRIFKNSPMLKEIQTSLTPVKDARGLSDIHLKITGKINDVNKIEFGKNLFVSGNLSLFYTDILLNNFAKPITKIYGSIGFNNLDINLNLVSNILKSKLMISGKIKNDLADISVSANNFKIKDLVTFIDFPKLSVSRNNFDDVSSISLDASYKGKINDINPNSLDIKGTADLKNLKLIYSDIPIDILGGSIFLKNDIITMNKINARFGSMPTLLDGKIINIFKSPIADLYINSKPSQEFIDFFYNKNQIYPIKIKGDIQCSTLISGNIKKFSARTNLKLDEDASIYYMGASLGDPNAPINIVLDGVFSKNNINVRNFFYDKLISSQNNRKSIARQLSASGELSYSSDNVFFKNFKIKTETPTDTRIFNIIFKKPLIKRGLFTSNILLNGSYKNPVIKGPFALTGMDIPFFDMRIKDISLDFLTKNILLSAKGEIFSNIFNIDADLQNRLAPPYIFNDVNINLENIDINKIINSMKSQELEADKYKLSQSTQNQKKFEFSSLIIKKATLKADKVLLQALNAKNLIANLSLNNQRKLAVDNFSFQLAQGNLEGSLSYNLDSYDTNFDLKIKDANANLMMISLFDLPNQIFGDLSGDINLHCNGVTHNKCMQTLSGFAGFEVNQGRLPKLGSLEYLLKAGNLVKSGVTGLSINGIIDIISPLKTGNFETIKGTVDINDGLAKNIQILSKGKDLNLFMTGDYNFATFNANMFVYGRLTKKITTMLGPVGNLSLNTMFNTIPGINLSAISDKSILNNINRIPGIELSDKTYRIFAVDINGNINGDNYVESFKWVE